MFCVGRWRPTVFLRFDRPSNKKLKGKWTHWLASTTWWCYIGYISTKHYSPLLNKKDVGYFKRKTIPYASWAETIALLFIIHRFCVCLYYLKVLFLVEKYIDCWTRGGSTSQELLMRSTILRKSSWNCCR